MSTLIIDNLKVLKLNDESVATCTEVLYDEALLDIPWARTVEQSAAEVMIGDVPLPELDCRG